ncbi:MAG: OmpA family protein [Rhodospirillaceae bacterium]|nr:OmpA family protein [Rhodospirillaceae bacterium]
MKIKNLIITGASALVLSACTGGADIDAVRGAASKGSMFQQGLHREYSTLAVMERAEADWSDADYFNERARSASMGKSGGPQNMNARQIPADKVRILGKARARLMRALDNGGADVMPQPAARAQAMFDCWMQEQEENFQPDDIAACRAAFDVALKAVESALEPVRMAKPMKKMAAPMPKSFIVYFDFDQSSLNGAANAVISQIAASAYSGKPKSIAVVGHTDRAGSNGYNYGLSIKRARAVAKALSERGLSQVKTSNFGETKPWMGTADGARQALNRRVEVNFK